MPPFYHCDKARETDDYSASARVFRNTHSCNNTEHLQTYKIKRLEEKRWGKNSSKAASPFHHSPPKSLGSPHFLPCHKHTPDTDSENLCGLRTGLNIHHIHNLVTPQSQTPMQHIKARHFIIPIHFLKGLPNNNGKYTLLKCRFRQRTLIQHNRYVTMAFPFPTKPHLRDCLFLIPVKKEVSG